MLTLHARTNDPIFISYSRANTDFAKDLYQKLKDLGFALWRDRSEMEAGKDWWHQIKEAIDKSATMVLCLSPKSLESPIVAQEWRHARQVGTRVIPIIVEDVEFKSVPKWMGRKDWLDFRPAAPENQLIWDKFITQLNTPYEPVRVPFMVESLPDDFVRREKELESLVGKLLDTSGEAVALTAALRGAGGFGKTTLARAICHEERVQQAFEDGILWVQLSDNPGDLLGRIVDLIEVLSGTRPGFQTIEAARSRLTELLKDRRILMVIDDVWDEAHLKPFLGLGKYCAYMITTRNAETLPTNSERVNVDAMSSAEAVSLLRTGLPDGADDEMQKLAGRLGEWALLLKLVNAAQRDRYERSQSLDEALKHVNTALDKRGMAYFDKTSSSERNAAAGKTLELSIDLLKPEDQACYERLAIFREDDDIPLAALEKLWSMDEFDSEDLCLRLDKLSLLLRLDVQTRTLRLHDVVRAYLRKEHEKHLPEWNETFLARYSVSEWHMLPTDELYLWRALSYHLMEAGQKDKLRPLLLDYRWLRAKLNAIDVNTLVADCNLLAETDAVVKLLRSALTMSAHMIALDKNLLPDQLYGRLLTYDDMPDIKVLRVMARDELKFVPEHHPPLGQAGGTQRLTRRGHTMHVTGCAYSPDGRFIVSGSSDRTLKVWDAATGEERLTLTGHTAGVTGCAYSPDGHFIVSASNDRTLKVWDAATGEERLTLTGHTVEVTGCAYSPDGHFIVSASNDNTLQVWDAATGKERLTLTGHTASVTGCAYSPDGRFIVSASWDKTLRVWDMATGEERLTLTGHTVEVTGCAYSPDGRFIVSASGLTVWDATTGEEQRMLTGHTASVTGCAYSPDGRFIVSASWDKTLRLWDAATGEERLTLTGHTAGVTGCAYSPDGRFIVSVSYDGALKVWEVVAIGEERLTLTGHTAEVTGCAYSPDGHFIVSGSSDRTLKVWDAATGEERLTLTGHTAEVTGCAYSPDGHYIVSASNDNTLQVWDAATGKKQLKLTGHTTGVTGCAYSPDGHYIVSGSSDRTLKVWDTATEGERGMFTDHTDRVTGCAYSPDGHYIVSASNDNTLQVWEAERKEIWLRSGDATLHLWEAASGKKQLKLTGHTAGVTGCAYSPDGHYIVSASNDNTLQVWDAATGKKQLKLTGHTTGVTGCAYSPDGHYIVSGSSDRTLKVWDTATGQCLATFYGDEAFLCCAWSVSGQIAAGDKLGKVLFFRLQL